MNYSKKTLKSIVKSVYTKKAFSEKLGFLYYNGSISRKINNIINEYGLDISHFNQQEGKRKYQKINKKCPICGTEFITNIKENKTTCSYSCSNTFFRSGPNNGSWKDSSYRSTCFHYHKKKCVICGEFRIVEVHHLDNNHKNNSPENLIPLCPTHHKYQHSRYKELILSKIEKYKNNYLLKINNTKDEL